MDVSKNRSVYRLCKYLYIKLKLINKLFDICFLQKLGCAQRMDRAMERDHVPRWESTIVKTGVNALTFDYALTLDHALI